MSADLTQYRKLAEEAEPVVCATCGGSGWIQYFNADTDETGEAGCAACQGEGRFESPLAAAVRTLCDMVEAEVTDEMADRALAQWFGSDQYLNGGVPTAPRSAMRRALKAALTPVAS